MWCSLEATTNQDSALKSMGSMRSLTENMETAVHGDFLWIYLIASH